MAKILWKPTASQIKKLRLSVVVPVYNERKTLAEIIKRVKRTKLAWEIIVVDDGSSDGSSALLKRNWRRWGVKPAFHRANKGKGFAIRTGIKMARGKWLLIQDADLEYDPKDYFSLIRVALDNKGKVIYGSRFTGERRNMFYWHWIGNRMLTFITNILYNTTLSDMETCYKMFELKTLRQIRLRSNRFDFEPEVTAKLLKRGVRIYEVPISYQGREFDEGKKITWRDGLGALWVLIKYRFID